MAGAREGRVFGEKAVAGMDRVDLFFGGQRDDRVDIEVSLHGTFAAADQVGFVGFEAMQAEAIFLRVDGDGAELELVGGAENADGDLASIEREEFFHEPSIFAHGVGRVGAWRIGPGAVSAMRRAGGARRGYNGGVKILALALCLGVVPLAAQQERDGNFTVRFEPTATLQTGAPIPFQIRVWDADHRPLTLAKVKLQIETANRGDVKVYPAPEVDPRATPGVYVAKPEFPSAGEWNVLVEVRHQNGQWTEVTNRTIQLTVPQ